MGNLQYEEIGKNYRFFLTWRYGIFAAYLILFWSTSSIASNMLEKKYDPFIVGFVFLIALVISICLHMAELKNRKLYRSLVENGKNLETSSNEAFSTLSSLSSVYKRWEPISQSVSLNILAFVSFVVFLNGGIILFHRPDLNNFSWDSILCFWQVFMISIDVIIFIWMDPFGFHYFFENKDKNKSIKTGDSKSK